MSRIIIRIHMVVWRLCDVMRGARTLQLLRYLMSPVLDPDGGLEAEMRHGKLSLCKFS